MDERLARNTPGALRNTVGVDARRDRLRRYVTWTPEDLAEFTKALQDQRVVDERDWCADGDRLSGS